MALFHWFSAAGRGERQGEAEPDRRSPAPRRGSVRWPTFGAAFIFLENGEFVECTVTQMSCAGAMLKLEAPVHLRAEVEVWLPTEEVRSIARVAWRKGVFLGVEFLDPEVCAKLERKAEEKELSRDRRALLVDRLKHAREGHDADPTEDRG